MKVSSRHIQRISIILFMLIPIIHGCSLTKKTIPSPEKSLPSPPSIPSQQPLEKPPSTQEKTPSAQWEILEEERIFEKQESTQEIVGIPESLTTVKNSAPITLLATVEPAEAKVRILNIKPKYKPYMQLPAGKYHMEASLPGYETVRSWIEVYPGRLGEWKVRLKLESK